MEQVLVDDPRIASAAEEAILRAGQGMVPLLQQRAAMATQYVDLDRLCALLLQLDREQPLRSILAALRNGTVRPDPACGKLRARIAAAVTEDLRTLAAPGIRFRPLSVALSLAALSQCLTFAELTDAAYHQDKHAELADDIQLALAEAYLADSEPETLKAYASVITEHGGRKRAPSWVVCGSTHALRQNELCNELKADTQIYAAIGIAQIRLKHKEYALAAGVLEQALVSAQRARRLSADTLPQMDAASLRQAFPPFVDQAARSLDILRSSCDKRACDLLAWCYLKLPDVEKALACERRTLEWWPQVRADVRARIALLERGEAGAVLKLIEDQ